MVEGAPLLREYRVKNLIEGSNPSLSANMKAERIVRFHIGEKRDDSNRAQLLFLSAGQPVFNTLHTDTGAICGEDSCFRFCLRAASSSR